MKPVDKIFYFGNGNVVAFDGEDQVPEIQKNCFMESLQRLLDRGAIDTHTFLELDGWQDVTVQYLIDSKRLTAPLKPLHTSMILMEDRSEWLDALNEAVTDNKSEDEFVFLNIWWIDIYNHTY